MISLLRHRAHPSRVTYHSIDAKTILLYHKIDSAVLGVHISIISYPTYFSKDEFISHKISTVTFPQNVQYLLYFTSQCLC